MTRKLIISFFAGSLLLMAAIIYGGLTMVQIATPANPASGSNKLYFKSDNKLYSLTSTGTETEIGAGGSASAVCENAGYYCITEEFAGHFASASTGSGRVIGDHTWFMDPLSGSTMRTDQTAVSSTSPTEGPDHPGQWTLATGNTSGNTLILYLGGYAQPNYWVAGTKTGWSQRMVFKLLTTTQQELYVGLMREPSVFTPNNFLGVQQDVTTTAGNFFLAARMYGGTAGTYDSGVAVDTGWHTLLIRGDTATASKVYLSLDGGTERSFCASGCDTTATVDTYPLATQFRLKSKEAVDKQIVADLVKIKYKVSATEVRP